MIRDWRQINVANVNTYAQGYVSLMGRTWIGECCSDTDLDGMRHVMSLKPNMIVPFDDYTYFPIRLFRNPKCLAIYIDYGGPFRDFFMSHCIGGTELWRKVKYQHGVQLLFERGAEIPITNSYKLRHVTSWIISIYNEVATKRSNCGLACTVLLGIRKMSKNRSPLANVAERDVLQLIVGHLWNTRTNEKWRI